jgi:hypothetical protein
MRETSKDELTSALWGLLRMIAGYAEWQRVRDVPDQNKAEQLCMISIAELNELNQDIMTADQRRIDALTRKLKAYQQIRLLQKFMFDEVEWD